MADPSKPEIVKPKPPALNLSWESIGKLKRDEYNALSRQQQQEISEWVVNKRGKRT